MPLACAGQMVVVYLHEQEVELLCISFTHQTAVLQMELVRARHSLKVMFGSVQSNWSRWQLISNEHSLTPSIPTYSPPALSDLVYFLCV